jgi:predicted  nucleic acid-binding Zn-ribbon protein
MIQADTAETNTSVHNGLTCCLGFSPLNLRGVGKEGIPKAPIPVRQPVFPQPPRRLSAAAEPGKESGSRPTPVDPEKPSFGLEHATIASRPNEPIRADTPRETISPTGRAVDPSQERVVDIEKTGEVNSALSEPTQVHHLHRERQDIPENPSSRVPLKPIHNQLQPSKRRRAPEKDICSKQHAPLVGGKNGVQLSEDDLFELLITRMRQREESEQAAAAIQRQVTNENVALKEENLNLQDRLRKCQAQLAKTSSESRSQRAQIDKWKVKLGTFKGVLNELGREYGAVREQAKELKEATMSLDREKSEIQHSLEDIRLKVSESAETIRDQRERLSISDGTVASLREALDHSEKRGDLIKTQLSNEKKRVTTLETYIQNESQSQSRYLALVRNDQRKMAEKLDSVCELFNTSFTKSQDNILSKLSPAIENCLTSVQGLKKQCSAETMNVQDFTNSVHEATSR